MRILLVVFSSLFILACNPRMTNSYQGDKANQPVKNRMQSVYDNWYDSFLAEGEKKKHSDYVSIVSETSEGNFIKRVFFPDTKTMTHYNEYNDRAMYVKHGVEKVWSDTGNLTNECQYSDGKKMGLYRNFNRKTGKVVNEGNYPNGKKEGLWKHYDSEGNIKGQNHYKTGLKNGLSIMYNNEGEVTANIEYKADTIYSSKIMDTKEEVKTTIAEVMPMYGNGCPEKSTLKEQNECSSQKMLMAIYKNLRYPPMAREYGLQGTAIVQFFIDESGKMVELEVIRGLNKEITDEILRVANLLEDWVPGMQRGEPVKIKYTLPMRFKLEG